MFINFKFSKNKIASIIFLLIALFISLFLGSYNQFIIHSEPGTIPLSNILEPLDNISPESEHVQAPPKVDPAYRY